MLQIVTHSGKFHADDVLAWSLLQYFYPFDMKLTRTRDQVVIEQADIVFDVGNIYAPEQKRFDHHQNEYQGQYSSAGMILSWLHTEKYISTPIFQALRDTIVKYVDDVDNGRIETSSKVPCFATIVSLLNRKAHTLEEFDQQFHIASNFTSNIIDGIVAEQKKRAEAELTVVQQMKLAETTGSNILEFSYYIPWKTSYFANGGATHPTEFVIFPTLQNTWQAVAIPPSEDSFAQKRSFPQEWAGLRDEELSQITGQSAIFCHKNRFIAVFETREDLLKAMKKFLLM